MRISHRIVLLTLCTIVAPRSVYAQNIKLVTFRSDSSVVLRWIGNSDPSITAWYVERSVDGRTYERLTTQPLTREFSAARAKERVGASGAGFYRMLFGVDTERNLTQQDIVRTLSNKNAGFHFVLLAAHPELSELTGERYVDRMPKASSGRATYRIVGIAGGVETIKVESKPIDLARTDRVPVPDSVIAEGPDNLIRLRWERNAEQSDRGDVVAFRVWKGANETGPFEEETSSALLTMFSNKEEEAWYSWTDEYVDNGTTAFYYVRQVHGTGELGDRSEIVVATAGATAPPPTPQRFRIALFGEAIQLDWNWPYVHPAYELDLVRVELSRPHTRLVKSLSSSDTSYLDALVESGKAYMYVLVTRTKADSAYSDTVSMFLADVVAPLPPSGVKAFADTGRIRLTWEPPSDPDVVGYRVHRSSSSLKNQLLLTPKLIVNTTFTDTLSRESEATNGYTITAEDRTGNSSAPSVMITARTIDVMPPVAPQITRFERQGDDVAIAWTACVSKDLAIYHVERSDSVEVWQTVHSTTNTNAAVKHGGVGTHRFRIRAEDSSKNKSGPSIERVVTIDARLIAPPNAKVTNVDVALKIEWTFVEGADGYRVDRVDPRTGKRTTCATLASNVKTWNDRISPRGESWTYEIAARDSEWKFGPAATAAYTPPKE